MYRKKVLSNAVALSLGLSAAGVIGVAHADADLLFPYVVSGDDVTTLLSVVNTAPPAPGSGRPFPQFTYDLDIALNYKLGSPTTDPNWNRDGCDHFDRTITTSVNDLSTFDIGGQRFGTGAMFNDTVGGTGAFLADVATFPGFRGYVHIRDLTPNLPANERTLEGDALVIDFRTGAAWGYRGLSRSDTAGDTSWFQNLSNATYDVYPNIPALAAERGLNIPFMPMDQVNTRFFITVLNDRVMDQFDGVPGSVIAQMGGGGGQTLFNRLEQSRSLNASVLIDCLGVVDIQGFLSAVAGTPFMAQGGFSALNIRDANPEGLGLVDGKLAHVVKLEWALDPVAIDGEPVNGTFNNSYQLNYVTNALEADGVFPVEGWSVADRVTS